MGKEFINPPTMARPRGYSQLVATRGGTTVYIAGQVAHDERSQLVGKGDLRAQTQQVYENLKAALAAAGATFGDVVKLNTYVVGYKPEHRSVIVEVRSQYVPAERPPASTL